MGTSFTPLSAIIAVLIIAFLFASLPQVNHKTRYRVLYAIAIIILLAVIPINEYMVGDTQNSNNNYLPSNPQLLYRRGFWGPSLTTIKDYPILHLILYCNRLTSPYPTMRLEAIRILQPRTSQDTVYRVSGAKCEPALLFDMGKYKLPIEYERWYSIKDYEREGLNYWRISRMDENARFYYLTAMWQKTTNKKRGHKDDVKYIVYDKMAKCGFVTKGLHASKITDDILGGPAFWPWWTTARPASGWSPNISHRFPPMSTIRLIKRFFLPIKRIVKEDF